MVGCEEDHPTLSALSSECHLERSNNKPTTHHTLTCTLDVDMLVKELQHYSNETIATHIDLRV